MTKVLLFMSILTAASPRASTAGEPARAGITVRTYNYAGIAVDQFEAAKMETERIFKRAGIAVAWTECRVPRAASGATCTEPLLDGRDLMLRLVDRNPAEGERIVALGESMLDRERHGVLMTIDMVPVRAVADRTLAALPTLMGRAIAHEIGHLLLGRAEHARAGLMRALWSHDELRGLKPANWEFSAREATQMRETLRQLSRTAD